MNGGRYSVKVTALNKAKLVSMAESDPVTVVVVSRKRENERKREREKDCQCHRDCV